MRTFAWLLLAGALVGCGKKSAKAIELSNDVCACADADCARTKLKLVEGHVADLKAMKLSDAEAALVTDALTDARRCAGKQGVGPQAEDDEAPKKKAKKVSDNEDESSALARQVFADGRFAILAPGPFTFTEKAGPKSTSYKKSFSVDGSTLQFQQIVRATPAVGSKTDPKLHDVMIGAEVKAAKGTELDRETRKLKKSKLQATFVEYDDPSEGRTRLVVMAVDDSSAFLIRAFRKSGSVDKAWFTRIADSFEVLQE